VEFALGFVIALAISLTGVGAGSMTTPLLILLLGVAPTTAVGTALTFGAIVKLASVPFYAFRRQVNLRILRILLAGGIPGVLLGAFSLEWLKRASFSGVLYITLGGLIVFTALFHLYRMFRPRPESGHRERPHWIWSLAFPIGAEVGFSSAGAGALGSLLLLSFTRLTAAEVIGTDLCFGLALSAAGSVIQVGAGNYDAALLIKLVIGGLIGSLCGSMLAGRLPQRPLRVALLLMLVILGTQLALHGSPAAPPVHAVLQALNR
jgi:uncharacterized membrane protein YfcA